MRERSKPQWPSNPASRDFLAQGRGSERTSPEERDYERALSPSHPLRRVGVVATCEGLQGDGGAVTEGDGEHCSKVR